MFEYVFLIIILSCLSLCFEHPFDVMKTWWQANPGLPSLKVVISRIHQARGVYGFYCGFLPNMIRILSKQAYRYPLMIFLPLFYKSIFEEKWFISFLCALTIAFFEVLVITPLEHLKVRLILIFQKNHLSFDVYKGFHIVALRQIVSWGSFLCSHDLLTFIFPNAHFLIIGVMVGILNTLCTLPFDCMKTCIQSGKARTIQEAYAQIHSYKGFYKGVEPRMIQYTINAAFTLFILEKFKGF